MSATLLTIRELSAWIRISTKTIYDWVATQRIPYKKIGSRVLFCPKQIEIWLDSLQRGPKVLQNIGRETASEIEEDDL